MFVTDLIPKVLAILIMVLAMLFFTIGVIVVWLIEYTNRVSTSTLYRALLEVWASVLDFALYTMKTDLTEEAVSHDRS